MIKIIKKNNMDRLFEWIIKRLFKPNLHKHKFWVESENKFVTLTLSTKGMRIIDKNGIDAVLKDIRSKGIKV